MVFPDGAGRIAAFRQRALADLDVPPAGRHRGRAGNPGRARCLRDGAALAPHRRHRTVSADRPAAALRPRLPRAASRECGLPLRRHRARRQCRVAAVPTALPAIAALTNGAYRRARMVPQLPLRRGARARPRLHRGPRRSRAASPSTLRRRRRGWCCAPATMRAARAAPHADDLAARSSGSAARRLAAARARPPAYVVDRGSGPDDHRRLSVVHRLGPRHLHRDARPAARHRPARRGARRSCSRGRARCREGMLPNRFPERGEPPEYNSVDASLWFVVAVHDYLARCAAGDPPRLTRRALGAAVAGDPRTATPPARASASAPTRTACCARASPACSSPGWTRRWAIGWSRRASASRSRCRRCGSTRCASAARWSARWAAARGRGARRSFRRALLEPGRRRPVRRRRRRPRAGTRRRDASARTRSSPSAACRSRCSTATAARGVVDLVEARLLTPLGLRSLGAGRSRLRRRATAADPRERDARLSPGHRLAVADRPVRRGVAARARQHGEARKAEARARFLAAAAARISTTAGLGHVSRDRRRRAAAHAAAAARSRPGRSASCMRAAGACWTYDASNGAAAMTTAPDGALPPQHPARDRGRAPPAVLPRRPRLAALGALSQRAAMGHGARGLQPGRHRLGLLPARSRPQPRLSLGRGRHRRLQRRPAAAVPRARAVERPRPDPEGAAVRPDQQRRQSRRGRQGALLLPRRHADALLPEDALQVSAGGVSLRAAGRGEPPPRHGRAGVRAASTPASSTTTATSTSFVEYAKADARRHPDADHRAQPRARGGAAARAAAALVPQHLVVAARTRRSPMLRAAATARSRPSTRSSAPIRLFCDGDAASCCSARTRPTRAGCSAVDAAGLLQGRIPRLRRRRRRRRGQSAARAAPRPPRTIGSTVAGGRHAQRARCACARRRRHGAVRRFRRASSTRAAREADDFYAALQHDIADRGRARSCSARPSPGCSGASSSTTTTCRSGSTATRRSRRRRRSASTGRNADWAHLNNADIISMPDKWEYPGTPPGTSRSTASRWR